MILELQGVVAEGPSEAAATFFGFMGVAISLSFASKCQVSFCVVSQLMVSSYPAVMNRH